MGMWEYETVLPSSEHGNILGTLDMGAWNNGVKVHGSCCRARIRNTLGTLDTWGRGIMGSWQHWEHGNTGQVVAELSMHGNQAHTPGDGLFVRCPIRVRVKTHTDDRLASREHGDAFREGALRRVGLHGRCNTPHVISGVTCLLSGMCPSCEVVNTTHSSEGHPCQGMGTGAKLRAVRNLPEGAGWGGVRCPRWTNTTTGLFGGDDER